MTGSSNSRRGAIAHVLVGTLSVGIIISAFVASVPRSVPTTVPRAEVSTRPADPPALTPHELATFLTRAGLGPKELAAAGVTAQGATALVNRAKDYLADHIADLRQVESSRASANGDSGRLTRKIQSGLGSAEDVSALQTARSSLASAMSARESGLSAFREAAIGGGQSGLSQEQASVLAAIRSRADSKGVPLQYQCGPFTHSDLFTLRVALGNVRVATQSGEEPNPADTAIIASREADTAIAAAKANLDSLSPSVSTAWKEAVYGQ